MSFRAARQAFSARASGSAAGEASKAAALPASFVVLLTLLLASCGEPEPETDYEDPESLPRMQSERVMQISEAGGRPLGEVQGLAANAEGELLIGDGDRQQIYRLGEDGTMLQTLGGEGFGPGEMQELRDLAMGFDGERLFAYDHGERRVLTFRHGQNGYEPESAFEVVSRAQSNPHTLHALSSERLLVEYAPIVDFMGEPADGAQMVLFDAVEGEVLIHDFLYVKARERIVEEFQGGLSTMMRPLGRRTLLAPSARQTVYRTWSDSLKIDVFDGDGNQTGRISWPLPARELTPEREEQLLTGYDEQARQMVRGHLPETHPLLENLQSDEQSRIWVQVDTAHPIEENWLVFSPDGEPLARLSLPDELQVAFIRDGRVYGVREDDRTREVHVEVYRVEPGGVL